MSIGLIIVLFLLLFGLVLLVVAVSLSFLESQRKKQVSGMLAGAAEQVEAPPSRILTEEEERARFDLASFPLFNKVQAEIEQAGLTITPLGVLAFTAVATIIGAVVGLQIRVPVFREFAMAGFAIFFGSLPYLYVRIKRSRRLAEFEEQFPEALDFLARSMRAGHAFSVSLEMMADESPDPIGVEFRKVFHEQNLGAPLEAALRGLANRVPVIDVAFFVSAVLLQRETGGNLAEILTKLGYIIRERFRLKGQVKAASAHGRLTAIILSVMPILTMLALMVVAPEYLTSMAKDEHGKYIIIGVVTAQFAGYYWMKKIINIKV